MRCVEMLFVICCGPMPDKMASLSFLASIRLYSSFHELPNLSESLVMKLSVLAVSFLLYLATSANDIDSLFGSLQSWTPCLSSIQAWAHIQAMPSPIPAQDNCAVTLPPYPACATSNDLAASSWSKRVQVTQPSCSDPGGGLLELGDLCMSLQAAYMTGTNYQLYSPFYASASSSGSALGFNVLVSDGWVGTITSSSSMVGGGTYTSLITAYDWPYRMPLAQGCML